MEQRALLNFWVIKAMLEREPSIEDMMTSPVETVRLALVGRYFPNSSVQLVISPLEPILDNSIYL